MNTSENHEIQQEPLETILVKNLRADLKKQINFKYETRLHNLEIAERMIFHFIPPNIQSMKASELKKHGYDLVKLINHFNDQHGVKVAKKTTFFPQNVDDIKEQIEDELIEQKKLRTEAQKKGIQSGKKLEDTPAFKEGFLNRPLTPIHQKLATSKNKLIMRSKTPAKKREAENIESNNRPHWRF